MVSTSVGQGDLVHLNYIYSVFDNLLSARKMDTTFFWNVRDERGKTGNVDILTRFKREKTNIITIIPHTT
jgi:hypothetical protein